MKIDLRIRAKSSESHAVVCELSERLPVHISGACQLSCTFKVEQCKDYYRFMYEVQGDIGVVCQRCLEIFAYPYHHQAELAVCADDSVAETLMMSHECLVAVQEQLDLTQVLTDDLYLYVTEKHAEGELCQWSAP